jgi:transcriptional regulator with GAF, ATPase, and Fis domain
MATVAFSTSRSGSHEDLHPFERLAVTLSSSFSSLQHDEVEASVGSALEEIGRTFGVDECTLIGYRDRGGPTVMRSWAMSPHSPCTDEDLASMPWLVQRLARNTVVAVTPTAEVPYAARIDRAHAAATGVEARLAVPVIVGARVTHGLMIGSRQRHAEWRPPLIERLRLFGEILGAGLARVSQGESPAGTRDGAAEAQPSPALERGSDTETTRIVGDSAQLRLALERVAQVAPLDTTVLLLGETGTGKELFARVLHESSRRRRKPLVRVNCAALPPTLIESELFGHERGAFTGAAAMRQGRFELADGGSILLDEVGDLAPELQAKLLRILQEGEFERVGASKTRRVDVRVIAATHVDLETAVAEGRFRADLYYRLSVFPVTLPPLRDRPEDIPTLVWFFIHRHQTGMGRRITSIPPRVMDRLQQHDWPGNVRELENVIARAMIRSTDGTLQLDDVSPAGAPRRTSPGSAPGELETLDEVQRSHIERVLRECGGRINGAGNAAVRLGLHPNTLRFRIKKLGVARPDPHAGGSKAVFRTLQP